MKAKVEKVGYVLAILFYVILLISGIVSIVYASHLIIVPKTPIAIIASISMFGYYITSMFGFIRYTAELGFIPFLVFTVVPIFIWLNTLLLLT